MLATASTGRLSSIPKSLELFPTEPDNRTGKESARINWAASGKSRPCEAFGFLARVRGCVASENAVARIQVTKIGT